MKNLREREGTWQPPNWRNIPHLFFKATFPSWWLIGGLGWWFGFLGFPYERDCYLGEPLESQTTGPQTNNKPLAEFPILILQLFFGFDDPNNHRFERLRLSLSPTAPRKDARRAGCFATGWLVAVRGCVLCFFHMNLARFLNKKAAFFFWGLT